MCPPVHVRTREPVHFMAAASSCLALCMRTAHIQCSKLRALVHQQVKAAGWETSRVLHKFVQNTSPTRQQATCHSEYRVSNHLKSQPHTNARSDYQLATHCAKRISSSCLQLLMESNTNAQVNFTARLSHTRSSQMVKSNRAPSTLYLLCMGLLGHRPSGCVGTFAIVPSSWNVQWWYGHVIHLRSPIRSTVPALRGAARWLHASSIATRVPPSPRQNTMRRPSTTSMCGPNSVRT